MKNVAYELYFHKDAASEWYALDKSVREQFKKVLARRLVEPRIPSSALSGMPDCYKIKQRKSGYRLVYRVEDREIRVYVIAVGKRDKRSVYKDAKKRLQ